jgi:hypothetical protein
MVFNVTAVGEDGVHVSAYELFANGVGQVALILQVANADVPVVQIPELITSACIVGIAGPFVAACTRP